MKHKGLRKMRFWEFPQAVSLLDKEWNLGKSISGATGKVCAWIYLMEILQESEMVIVYKENRKIIGFCGYAKWKSKKHLIKKKFYSVLKKLLVASPKVKDKRALANYMKNYESIPEELKGRFDGELSILIVDKKYRGKGIGKKLLGKIFDVAEKDGIKRLQIITDESCNYDFYEKLHCRKVYEKTVENQEPYKLGDRKMEQAFIYEKVFE